MTVVIDWLSALLVLIGSLFCLIGALGIIKMPSFITRVHSASLIDSFWRHSHHYWADHPSRTHFNCNQVGVNSTFFIDYWPDSYSCFSQYGFTRRQTLYY